MSCFSLTTEGPDGHIAHLVLNRPEAMNTMHPRFWRELHEVLTGIHQAGTARALVISSTGKHFSAGMDLQTFGGAIQMDDSSAEGRSAVFDLLTDMQRTFTLLEDLRMPVIAAIQGGCIGGAVDMVTPYFGASGTGQLNAIFEVTPQKGEHIPAAQASSAQGYTAVSTRL